MIDKGKLPIQTTDEALQHKLADFLANSIDAVLQSLGRPMPKFAASRRTELRRLFASSLIRSRAHC